MLETVTTLVFAILAVALLFALWRLLRGPTLPDRVVALELAASLTVGFIAVDAIAIGVSSMLDVAVVLALTAFLAAVGFARYLEFGGRRDE
jgi:multicomponent Na+:H+ antiporter subunit F